MELYILLDGVDVSFDVRILGGVGLDVLVVGIADEWWCVMGIIVGRFVYTTVGNIDCQAESCDGDIDGLVL